MGARGGYEVWTCYLSDLGDSCGPQHLYLHSSGQPVRFLVRNRGLVHPRWLKVTRACVRRPRGRTRQPAARGCWQRSAANIAVCPGYALDRAVTPAAIGQNMGQAAFSIAHEDEAATGFGHLTGSNPPVTSTFPMVATHLLNPHYFTREGKWPTNTTRRNCRAIPPGASSRLQFSASLRKGSLHTAVQHHGEECRCRGFESLARYRLSPTLLLPDLDRLARPVAHLVGPLLPRPRHLDVLGP
jgi:hypothetical protein